MKQLKNTDLSEYATLTTLEKHRSKTDLTYHGVDYLPIDRSENEMGKCKCVDYSHIKFRYNNIEYDYLFHIDSGSSPGYWSKIDLNIEGSMYCIFWTHTSEIYLEPRVSHLKNKRVYIIAVYQNEINDEIALKSDIPTIPDEIAVYHNDRIYLVGTRTYLKRKC